MPLDNGFPFVDLSGGILLVAADTHQGGTTLALQTLDSLGHATPWQGETSESINAALGVPRAAGCKKLPSGEVTDTPPGLPGGVRT